MRYIDFDGVILDTEDYLFYDWYKIPNYHELTEEDKIRHVQCANWYKILHESNFINDSLYILKHILPEQIFVIVFAICVVGAFIGRPP